MLTLRPTPRPAIVIIAITIAGPALIMVGTWARSESTLLVGLWLMFYCTRSALILTVGVTRLWPDGLDNRLVGRQASVPWEQVERVVLVRTLFGRFLQVEERQGSRITLAAPRSGLLVTAKDFDADLRKIRESPGGRRPSLRIDTPRFPGPVATQALLLIGAVTAIAIDLAR